MMMTNTLLLRLATVLMLFSIHTVQAQTINTHVTNTTPNGRYTVHEPHKDGTRTVTDAVTGLMWQQCSVGQTGADCSGTASKHTWIDALGLAASANEAGTGGYSNWRLPNIRELQSIVAEDRFNPSINSVVFPNTPPSAYYWSSSPYVGAANYSSYAWVVYFGNGNDHYNYRDYNFSVRLVGSGQ